MKQLNRIQITGIVGRDCEPIGSAFKFSVAVKDSRKDKNTGEWTEETIWLEVISQENPQVKRGDLVFVDGKLRVHTYNDKARLQIVFPVIYKLQKADKGGQQASDYPDNDDSDNLTF